MEESDTKLSAIYNLTQDIIPDLDLLALKWVEPPGELEIVGKKPKWISSISIGPHQEFSALQFIQQSKLLRHAFARAQEFWDRQENGQYESGPLQERKLMGNDVRLEVIAFLIGREKFLHIKKLGLEFKELQRERQSQREAVLGKKRDQDRVEEEPYDGPDLIGKSPEMQKIFSKIQVRAFGGKTILIEGEPGTGKELVAQGIHSSGPRRHDPFIVSRPEDYAKFTTKTSQSNPKEIFQEKWVLHDLVCVKKAKKGTLFVKSFDKILENGDQNLSQGIFPGDQSGESKGLIDKVDTLQWILAVNCPLEELVAKNFLDLDILCRTSINRIKIPPLRDRKEDIPLFCTQFLAQRRVLKENWRIQEIEEEALERLCDYSWPGNVRELQQSVYYAFDQCGGDKIRVDDLPPSII